MQDKEIPPWHDYKLLDMEKSTMTTAEERILQKAKVPFDSNGFPLFAGLLSCWRGLGKVTEKSLLTNGWVKVEEVLQILAEQHVKWCELQKLLETQPFKEAFGKIEWDKRLDDYARALCMHDEYRRWFEVFKKKFAELTEEEKLKELQP